jgi:processive 1,2-diacylglycerol beta-glucosyltransferase
MKHSESGQRLGANARETRRILVATVTAGAGHLQAAAAVDEAWRAWRPDDIVQCLDLLTLVPKLQRKLYADGYARTVTHAPEVWGMLFKSTDDAAWVRRITRFRRAWAAATNRRFVRHLQRFRPDAVVCTHYLPVEVLGGMAALADRPLTVCVVTDFEAHALWMDQVVDLYCVATQETGASLRARGIAAERVLATGIPVAAKFSAETDVGEVRRRLGLRDDVPVLLVLSGGFGMGPVARILAELDRVEHAVQVLVVAGRNPTLRARLATMDIRHPVRVFGFVENMHELMAVSDLVLTKPGGLTSSEALAVGRPLFVLNPIPGQEAANSDFLLERGVAVKVNRVEDLPYRLNQLVGSTKLEEMARAAGKLGIPGAARRVCEATFERLTLPAATRTANGPRGDH